MKRTTMDVKSVVKTIRLYPEKINNGLKSPFPLLSILTFLFSPEFHSLLYTPYTNIERSLLSISNAEEMG